MHPHVRHTIHCFKRERERHGLYASDTNNWCSKLNSKCKLKSIDDEGRDTTKSSLMIFSVPDTPYIFSGCIIHRRYHICGDTSDPCTVVDVDSETGNIVCQMSGRCLGSQYEPTFNEHKGSISEYRAGNANFHSSIPDYGDDGDGDMESGIIDLYEESGYSHGDAQKTTGDTIGDADDEMDVDVETEQAESTIGISESSRIDKHTSEVVRFRKSGAVTGATQFDYIPIIPHPPPIHGLAESSLMARFRALPRHIDPLPFYAAFRSSAYIRNRLSIPKCLSILSGQVAVQTNIDSTLARKVAAFLTPAVISCADVIYTDKCASIATAVVMHMFVHTDTCDEAHASRLMHFNEHARELSGLKRKTYTDVKEIDNSIIASINTFINNILRASLELLKSGYRVKDVPVIEGDTHIRDLLMISCIEPSSKKPQRKTRHDPNTTKPEKKDAENTENQLKACLTHMVTVYGADFTRTRLLEFCDVHDPHYVSKIHFRR